MLVVKGSWLGRLGGLPEFRSGDLRDFGGPFGFDTRELGRWDSGLVAFLWDAVRAATSSGLKIDWSSLPDAIRYRAGAYERASRTGDVATRRSVLEYPISRAFGLDDRKRGELPSRGDPCLRGCRAVAPIRRRYLRRRPCRARASCARWPR